MFVVHRGVSVVLEGICTRNKNILAHISKIPTGAVYAAMRLRRAARGPWVCSTKGQAVWVSGCSHSRGAQVTAGVESEPWRMHQDCFGSSVGDVLSGPLTARQMQAIEVT